MSSLSQWLSSRSRRTRSILLYLFFVAISAVFWCFLTFNNDVTVDFRVPVTITGRPDNVKLLNVVPDTIKVTVRNKGTSFIKYMFKSTPRLVLSFDDYRDENHRTFAVSKAQLRDALVRIFGREATITAILPENFQASYTDQPGKRVPINLEMNVSTQPDFVQSGPISKSLDSVMVYGDAVDLADIREVYTNLLQAENLNDTVERSIAIVQPAGILVEPRKITVVIPVEALVNGEQDVPITAVNVPDGVTVRLFPATTKATFRMPGSYAHKFDNAIAAVVDYTTIDVHGGNKVPVIVDKAPGAYRDLKLDHDSVEYIISTSR